MNPNPTIDRHLALWMASQCHGLCVGLGQIHNSLPSLDDPDAGLSTDKPPSPRWIPKPYGRHNDIKPENILWFKDSQSSESISGTLKISDFGFTQFNSSQSRSGIPQRPVLLTPTYRPPECDMPEGEISQACDMWTLGCLYLEFIVWILKGVDATDDHFPDDRLRDETGTDFKEDTFFSTDGQSAHLKRSVVEVSTRQHRMPSAADSKLWFVFSGSTVFMLTKSARHTFTICWTSFSSLFSIPIPARETGVLGLLKSFSL